MTEAESETQQGAGLQLRDYVQVLHDRAWIIILAVVLLVGVALLYSYRATPLYQASAKMVFQTNSLDRTLFGSQVFANTNEPRDVETGAELVKIAQVAEAAKEQLKSPLSPQALTEMVSVTPSTASNLITIDAVSSSAQEAADVANAFATQFILFRKNTDQAIVAAARELVKAQMDSLSPQDASSSYAVMLREKYASLQILESMQTGGFYLVQSATPPELPFSPQPVRNGLLGLFAGLILGLSVAFLLNYFDNRIKDVKGLERCYGLPVLASVPTVGSNWKPSKNGDRSAAVGFASSPPLLESFRALRSSLQYFDNEDRPARSILITSALPREGKTMTSVNLAISLALSGKRVILVEADLRRPMVPSYLGLENKIGLSTILAGRSELTEALQLVKLRSFTPEIADYESPGERNEGALQRDLYCLSSGPQPPNPAELLGSDRMRQLILQLRPIMDYVVVDSPPILVVADALVLASLVDAVIVTARINSTTRDEADQASDLLRRSGGRVIGVVAEGVKAKGSYYGARGYGYGSSQAIESGGSARSSI